MGGIFLPWGTVRHGEYVGRRRDVGQNKRCKRRAWDGKRLDKCGVGRRRTEAHYSAAERYVGTEKTASDENGI